MVRQAPYAFGYVETDLRSPQQDDYGRGENPQDRL